jgi:reactive intermediate/imine deaminase
MGSKRLFSVFAATAILALGCAPSSEETVSEPVSMPSVQLTLERLGTLELEGAELPFSEAVRVGRTLYLSGKIGTVPGTGELAEGGIGPETRQTMENIRLVLERHGSSLESVASCAVYLADIAEWPAMNEVYRTFFTSGFPARSAMAASGLALGARVEITCIAIVEE